jgi:hypothetical protein
MAMSYTVTAVGDDWVELWDGVSIVDPDLPRHKSVERVFVGEPHPFQVNDVVALSVRLVARVIPPDTEPTNFSTITAPTDIDFADYEAEMRDAAI